MSYKDLFPGNAIMQIKIAEAIMAGKHKAQVVEEIECMPVQYDKAFKKLKDGRFIKDPVPILTEGGTNTSTQPSESEGPAKPFKITPATDPNAATNQGSSAADPVVKPTALNDQQKLLRAFEMIDGGFGVVDIMTDLNVSDAEILTYLQKYNGVRDEMARKDLFDERTFQAWFELCKIKGEHIRNSCDHYEDDNGTCNYWEISDVDPKFRKRFPGTFRAMGQRLRLSILSHPEHCATCPIGYKMRFE